MNVPKLLELAFAELQFEFLVKAVAEVGADRSSRRALSLVVSGPVILFPQFAVLKFPLNGLNRQRNRAVKSFS